MWLSNLLAAVYPSAGQGSLGSTKLASALCHAAGRPLAARAAAKRCSQRGRGATESAEPDVDVSSEETAEDLITHVASFEHSLSALIDGGRRRHPPNEAL